MPIRQYLDAHGIRQNWLAGQMGITPEHLCRVMRGKYPWTPRLRALALAALNAPADAVSFFAPDIAHAQETQSHEQVSQST